MTYWFLCSYIILCLSFVNLEFNRNIFDFFSESTESILKRRDFKGKMFFDTFVKFPCSCFCVKIAWSCIHNWKCFAKYLVMQRFIIIIENDEAKEKRM